MKNGIASFYVDPSTASLAAPNLEIARKLMTNAVSKGYYNPPAISELFPDINLLSFTENAQGLNKMQMHIDHLLENSSLIKISGWGFLEEKNRKTQRIGIVLLSESNKFIFSTNDAKRNDVISHFKNEYKRILEECGFNFVLDKASFNILSGKYKVGICIYDNDQIQSIKYSNKYVKF